MTRNRPSSNLTRRFSPAPVSVWVIITIVIAGLAGCFTWPTQTATRTPTPIQNSTWRAKHTSATGLMDEKNWNQANLILTEVIEDKIKTYTGKTRVTEPYSESDIKKLPRDNDVIFWHRGFARRNMMLYPAARNDYRCALILNPGDIPSLRELGWLALGVGKPDEAARFAQYMLQSLRIRRTKSAANRSRSGNAENAGAPAIRLPSDSGKDIKKEQKQLDFNTIQAKLIIIRADLQKMIQATSKPDKQTYRDAADREWKSLVANYPDNNSVLAVRAAFYIADKQYDAAQKILDDVFSRQIISTRYVSAGPGKPQQEITIRQEPIIPYGDYLRGRVEEHRGDYDAAIESYSKAIDAGLVPAVDIYLARANLYMYLGNNILALQDYESVAYAMPENPLAHIGIARSHVRMKNWLVALNILNTLLGVSNDDIPPPDPNAVSVILHKRVSRLDADTRAELHVLRARCYANLMRYNFALDDLNAAVDIAPKNVMAISFRATVHAALGHDDAAIADYTTWSHLDTISPEPLIQLADYYLKSGRPADGLAAADVAVKRAGKDYPSVSAILVRTRALLAMGKPNQAEAAATDVTELDPSLQDGWRMLARARLLQDKDTDALNALDHAVTQQNVTEQTLCDHAILAANLGHLNNALKDIDAAMLVNTKSSLPMRTRSRIHLDAGQIDLSLRYASDAVKLEPLVVENRIARGYAYAVAGDRDYALLDAEYAITRTAQDNPTRPRALWLKGVMVLLQGDVDAARTAFAAAAGRPNGEPAARELMLLDALSGDKPAVWHGGALFAGSWIYDRLERRLFRALAAGESPRSLEKLVTAYDPTSTILSADSYETQIRYTQMILALAKQNRAEAKKYLDRIMAIDTNITDRLEAGIAIAISNRLTSHAPKK